VPWPQYLEEDIYILVVKYSSANLLLQADVAAQVLKQHQVLLDVTQVLEFRPAGELQDVLLLVDVQEIKLLLQKGLQQLKRLQ